MTGARDDLAAVKAMLKTTIASSTIQGGAFVLGDTRMTFARTGDGYYDDSAVLDLDKFAATVQAHFAAREALVKSAFDVAWDEGWNTLSSITDPYIAELEAELAAAKAALEPFATALPFWDALLGTSEIMREPPELATLWRNKNKRLSIPQLSVTDLRRAADALANDPREGDRGGQFSDRSRKPSDDPRPAGDPGAA